MLECSGSSRTISDVAFRVGTCDPENCKNDGRAPDEHSPGFASMGQTARQLWFLQPTPRELVGIAPLVPAQLKKQFIDFARRQAYVKSRPLRRPTFEPNGILVLGHLHAYRRRVCRRGIVHCDLRSRMKGGLRGCGRQ